MLHTSIEDFPEPGDEARAHSDALRTHIRYEIEAAGGAISFARYMELALYAPGLGYYSAGARKFGAAGDFVTAPEISDLFSRCLARQIAPVIRETQGMVLELGAGSGRMAADMLLELEKLEALPERYAIVEVSADLKQRQQELLNEAIPSFIDRVEWLEVLPEHTLHGVIISNEVLDALPVERFSVANDGFLQWQVTISRENRFRWQRRPAPESLRTRLENLVSDLPHSLHAGYTSECCPNLGPFVATLASLLQHGMLLFVDYGMPRREYYHPQRIDGTLLCHYRHRAHADPFFLPGLQDITADVDFTSVAEAGVDSGLELIGYTSQMQFLLAAELEQLLAECDPDDERAYLELTRQAKLLTLPGEMGERFKFIGFGRGLGTMLPGFTARDMSAML